MPFVLASSTMCVFAMPPGRMGGSPRICAAPRQGHGPQLNS